MYVGKGTCPRDCGDLFDISRRQSTNTVCGQKETGNLGKEVPDICM
jgi:hypothetical protein